MFQAFKLAYRNVGRNKTRSLLSALAVGIGMALLLLMAAVRALPTRVLETAADGTVPACVTRSVLVETAGVPAADVPFADLRAAIRTGRDQAHPCFRHVCLDVDRGLEPWDHPVSIPV